MSKPEAEECEDSPFEVDSDEDDEGNLVPVAGAVELEELQEGAEQAYDLGAAPYMFEPRLPEGELLGREMQPRPENNERLHVLDW